jgi:hypothetical protein
MDRIRTRQAPILRASGNVMWRSGIAPSRRPLAPSAVIFPRLLSQVGTDPKRRHTQ